MVQAVAVAIPFAILGLALDRDFFEDWGWAVGPGVWLACSVVTARVLALPLGYVLFSAVAGEWRDSGDRWPPPTCRAWDSPAGLRRLVRQLRPGRGSRGAEGVGGGAGGERTAAK